MRVLGINSGRAVPPRVDPARQRALNDGSAALIEDGQIVCATIEERHTRSRYHSGFRRSLATCLRQARAQLEEIDWLAHSTCCDTAWQRPDDVIDDLCEELSGLYDHRRVQRHFAGRVRTIDHHESHAMLAFVASGARQALVCVVDGMGNRLSSDGLFHLGPDWWKGAFQRQSYFLAQWHDSYVRLTKVHEEANTDGEIGLGELYRALTHFLGWPTYQHAGKAMALAAYGNPTALKEVKLVEVGADTRMRVLLDNKHDTPLEQMESVLGAAGIKVPENLTRPATHHARFLCNFAALVQRQLEEGLIQVASRLAETHKLSDVCFAGGVALNCLAMGRLRARRPDLRIHVAPAPADTGQGLGNALWLAVNDLSPAKTRLSNKIVVRPDLGPLYSTTIWDEAVANLTANDAHIRAQKYSSDAAMASALADIIVAGHAVGLRRGRAEYGPRALGHSSILADPRSPDMPQRVNEIKCREPFRPFAPSILDEFTDAYIAGSGPSPFMSFAAPVREEMRPKIPAVVHVDGSARYHTVSRADGFYRTVLEAFAERTGIPVLLNTSLNVDGIPIAETPADCIDLFRRSRMRAMAVDNWIIEKSE